MRNVLILAAAGFLAAAGSAQAAALTDQPLVDTAWLKDHLGHEDLVVLDIRDSVKNGETGAVTDLYAQGHVPGAVHAPYAASGWRAKQGETVGMLPPVEDLEQKIGALGIDDDTHVVIVPNGTDASDFGSATRVYWTFKVLGHDEVSILEGGWKGWQSAGAPVSTDAATPDAAAFKADFQPQLIADAADVRAALDTGVELIDARPVEQYLGNSKSPVARVPGTIPGSANVANGLFYDGETGDFAGKDTIDALLAQVGVDPQGEQIAYCNTGHWASVAWFGLSEVQGNENVSMYDGSLADWTQDPSNPMVVYGSN